MPLTAPSASPYPLRCAPSTERALLRASQAGDARARELLLDQLMPLVRAVARRYARRPSELDDLRQVGAIGALKSIDRFDARHRVRLASFALPTITGEIRRHLRDTGWAVHLPRGVQETAWRLPRARNELRTRLGREPTDGEVAAELGIDLAACRDAERALQAGRVTSLDACSADGETPIAEPGAPDPAITGCVQRLDLQQAMRSLQRHERVAVGMAFVHERSQREIGRELGCSQMQVSRILRRAVGKLELRLHEPPEQAA